MRLENHLDVPVPPEQLFDVLLDLNRVAPCMSGAVLEESDGDRHVGTLKVRVGPIGAQSRGNIEFIQVDHASQRVVMKGVGRETRGQGGAEATITAQVHSTPGGSHVKLVTDLEIRGKVAQFGRGVLADRVPKDSSRRSPRTCSSRSVPPCGSVDHEGRCPRRTQCLACDRGPRAAAGPTSAPSTCRGDPAHPPRTKVISVVPHPAPGPEKNSVVIDQQEMT